MWNLGLLLLGTRLIVRGLFHLARLSFRYEDRSTGAFAMLPGALLSIKRSTDSGEMR